MSSMASSPKSPREREAREVPRRKHNHFDNGCCRLNDRLGERIHDYGC